MLPENPTPAPDQIASQPSAEEQPLEIVTDYVGHTFARFEKGWRPWRREETPPPPLAKAENNE